jgi:hypothetical protein
LTKSPELVIVFATESTSFVLENLLNGKFTLVAKEYAIVK